MRYLLQPRLPFPSAGRSIACGARHVGSPSGLPSSQSFVPTPIQQPCDTKSSPNYRISIWRDAALRAAIFIGTSLTSRKKSSAHPATSRRLTPRGRAEIDVDVVEAAGRDPNAVTIATDA